MATKRMAVTRGTFRGRIMQMDEAVAAQAVTDQWAYDPGEGNENPIPEGTDLRLDLPPPQSMLDWQAGIEPEPAPPDPEPEPEPETTRRTRRTAASTSDDESGS